MNFKRALLVIKREINLTEDERNLVDVLNKEYEPWIKSLTKKEIHAIRKYTKNSLDDNTKDKFYLRLNKMLRGDYNKNTRDYEKLCEYADIISKSIKKHAIEEDIICYRGTSQIPVSDYPIGLPFYYNQFISTSLFEKHAFKKKYKMVLYIKKGTKAAYINKISAYKSQYEVLLDKDCLYTLKSIKGNTYELEVCDNGNN